MRLRRDERGASSVEYGLIAVLIAAVVVAAVAVIGNLTSGTVGRPCDQLDAAGAASTCP